MLVFGHTAAFDRLHTIQAQKARQQRREGSRDTAPRPRPTLYAIVHRHSRSHRSGSVAFAALLTGAWSGCAPTQLPPKSDPSRRGGAKRNLAVALAISRRYSIAMRLLIALTIPLVLGGLSSCAPPAGPICDGSEGLRLGIHVSPSRAYSSGQGVAYELGDGYLYVTGTCEYYVWQSDDGGIWSPARTGKLTQGEAAELERDVSYASWPSWAGRNLTANGAFDASAFIFANGQSSFTCTNNCAQEPNAAGIQAAYADWRASLYARGEDLAGPIRLRAFREEEALAEELAWVTWPVETPISAIAQSTNLSGDLSGPTDVYEDANAEAFRALRAALTRGPEPDARAWVQEDGTSYFFAFRDVLPIEEDGKVPGAF